MPSLTHSPALFWATGGAATLLTLAALSAPVTQPVTAGMAFADSTTNICPTLLGSRVHTGESFVSPPRDDPEMRAYRADKYEVEAATARHAPGLQPAVKTFYGYGVRLELDAGEASEHVPVNLVFREGFADHVEPVSGPSGPGVWVPANLADRLGATVGNSVTMLPPEITSGLTHAIPLPENPDQYVEYDAERPFPSSTLRVSATYAEIAEPTGSDFWCGVPDLLPDPTLPMILLDEALLQGDDLGFLFFNPADVEADRSDNLAIDRPPVDDRPTLAEARELAEGIAAMHSEMATAKVTPESPQTYFPALDSEPPAYESGIAEAVADADADAAEVRPIATVVLVAGIVAGAAGLAAVGALWARRRGPELLQRVGMTINTFALGRRAAREAAVPAALGAVAAWIGAASVIWWLLPVAVQPLTLTSLSGAAAALVAALLLVALGAGLTNRSLALDEEFRSPRRELV